MPFHILLLRKLTGPELCVYCLQTSLNIPKPKMARHPGTCKGPCSDLEPDLQAAQGTVSAAVSAGAPGGWGGCTHTDREMYREP